MTAYIQSNVTLNINNANTNLSPLNSGCVLRVTSALTANRTVTLPAVQVGLHYRIILQLNLANSLIIAAQAPGLFNGLLLSTGAANLATLTRKNSANNVTFNNAALKGDYLDIISDGVAWYVSGMSTALGFT